MNLSLQSMRSRLVFAVLGNGSRAVLSFSAGVILARTMGPHEFGQMAFLLGTFTALRPLLDLGTSTAFYTFISRGRPVRPYLRLYLPWLLLQAVVLAAAVVYLLPEAVFQQIWLGYTRALVAFSLLTSFLQLQVWTTVSQVGEAQRDTFVVQLASVGIALTYLGSILILLRFSEVNLARVLACNVAIYATAALVAGVVLYRRQRQMNRGQGSGATDGFIFTEFYEYCRPLALSAIAGAAFTFGDNWMLQKFGGARPQGIYQAAFQFSAISLFATTSILQVFWKELADSHGRGDDARLAQLYLRASKFVVFAGATLSGLLIPWSAEIVQALLGSDYRDSAMILLLLFLYPVHQALGQVTGTLAFATGETKIYSEVIITFTILSLILSYVLLAPAHQSVLPGLGLGALGLGIKMVGLNIASVNVLGYRLARRRKWKFEWSYQWQSLAAGMLLGVAAKWLIGLVWGPGNGGIGQLAGPLLGAAALVGTGQILLLLRFPRLIGCTPAEVRAGVQLLRGQLARLRATARA